MLLQSIIHEVFISQQSQLKFNKKLVQREYQDTIDIGTSHIDVVTGIRRCGKSTLLKQITQSLNTEVAYLNFEDPRLFGFETSDFSKLDAVIGDGTTTYYFDEIQNVENWELYVRQLHDREKKVYITGSNASLLSKELGTRLTGRHLAHELFPFSYKEYLTFYNKKKSSTKLFVKYLKHGGFPEYLKNENIEILQTLLRDIVLRDIAIRHGIRNTDTLMKLTLFLLSNVGKEHTFNRLKNNFGIGSANTVSDYMQWLEDAYLLFYLPKFSYSAKVTAKNARKVYAIDTGFVRANSLSFSTDDGRILENAVYIHLKKQHQKLYYYQEKYECDFITFDQTKCTDAVQACIKVHPDNIDRETSGLLEAMAQFQLDEGTIVTLNQADKLTMEGKTIHLVPADQFFCR